MEAVRVFDPKIANLAWDAICINDFIDDATMRQFIYAWRWPDLGFPVCPYCNEVEVYQFSTRELLKCAACHRQFTITSNTPLHHMKLSDQTAMLVTAALYRGMRFDEISDMFGIRETTVRLLKYRLQAAGITDKAV